MNWKRLSKSAAVGFGFTFMIVGGFAFIAVPVVVLVLSKHFVLAAISAAVLLGIVITILDYTTSQ